jgi:adenylate cyclase
VDSIGKLLLKYPGWVVGFIFLGLAALPLAVWLDLRNLSDQTLQIQATSLDSIISKMRGYYSRNVVSRIKKNAGLTQTLHNYHDVLGAVPIPATFSIELGDLISKAEGNVDYRFVSDRAFTHRPPHVLDDFETAALRTFRQSGNTSKHISKLSGSVFDRKIRIATPVILADSCVSCHNQHPLSPKTDWVVGDVRGIQEIAIHQPVASNIFSFKYLLLYFLCAGTIGFAFAFTQFRQANSFRQINEELEAGNSFLASISMQISKYLSPQVYKSIFSGEKDASISTERKKLTIFFSDIKDFTETTERLQPEELTTLLNEYFTEMSRIALAHGATIDKFIGDAILAFFGDPETKGVVEDAKACMRMALEMQARLEELNIEWKQRGYEHPFSARMGINTGFCNVGNFGSSERMDYTIIGAEANLAARLESIAEPGGIVMSYETCILVQDIVQATALEPTKFKGIAREVIPFSARPVIQATTMQSSIIINERLPGINLFLDADAIDEADIDNAKKVLQDALDAVTSRK